MAVNTDVLLYWVLVLVKQSTCCQAENFMLHFRRCECSNTDWQTAGLVALVARVCVCVSVIHFCRTMTSAIHHHICISLIGITETWFNEIKDMRCIQHFHLVYKYSSYHCEPMQYWSWSRRQSFRFTRGMTNGLLWKQFVTSRGTMDDISVRISSTSDAVTSVLNWRASRTASLYNMHK